MINKIVVRVILITIILYIASPFGFCDDAPKRIVSLSPNLTQIIYALGAGDSIVGVTIYSEFPPEVKDLPKVGGWVNPNYESIVALKPDLVVLMKDQNTVNGSKISNLGLRTYVSKSNDSISDILESILGLGRILGKEKEAKELVGEIETTLSRISEKTKNEPKKSVLLVVGRNPGTLEDIYVIGRNNYMDELITLAGGENVVEHERQALKITKESILSYNPDVIIEINHQKIDREEEILNTWSSLDLVKAVQDKQVFILSSTVLLHPSQRIIEGARVLADTLHPGVLNDDGNNN